MDEGEILEGLVRQYSPSGREAPAVGEFLRVARRLGYTARADAVGNGIARRGSGRPRVMFLGHIDTVDGELPVRRSHGRLWGRGAVDAKGPLAAALMAGAGAAGAGEYLVVAAVGEETDSRGARHLLAHHRPDAVIVGEPSGWDGVTIAYKGEVQLEATFRGQRTHYSSPYPTTTDTAVAWLEAVKGYAVARAGVSPFRSLTAKTVEIVTERRGGIETVRTLVDLRVPTSMTTSEVIRDLPTEPGRPRLRIRLRVEPAEVDRANPVAAALLSGIRADGGRPTLWRKAGTSDLNLVLPTWRVPGAAYGPGDARLDHTDREVVSEAELRRASRVVRRALEELRRGPVRRPDRGPPG